MWTYLFIWGGVDRVHALTQLHSGFGVESAAHWMRGAHHDDCVVIFIALGHQRHKRTVKCW